MFKNVIMFPSRLGQPKFGVEKTPFFFKNLIRPNIIQHEVSVSNDLMSSLFNLYETNKLVKGNKVNIGGDHSMAIATVADSLRKYSNLKVVWFDAHCDINTYQESQSKNYHGMPLSILTGIEKDKSLNFTDKLLNPANLLYIGVRDIDPFESKIMLEHNIKYLTVNQVNTDPYKCWNIISDFINDNPVHFSFDVDGLDPSVIPSTGTTASNGIKLEPAFEIVNRMLQTNLKSVDITELNLEIGTVEDKEISLINTIHLFEKYIF